MAGNAVGAMKRVAQRAGLPVEVFAARVANGEKYCWRCRKLHQRSAFNPDVSRSDGLDPACRDSRNAAKRGQYIRRGRVSKRGSFYAKTRDGDKKQARARVNHRVDVGMIPDPNDLPCTDCGHVYKTGERRHEYDHHCGYGSAHQLDVQPVCTRCHRKREKLRG
jgi:hypothetical protein